MPHPIPRAVMQTICARLRKLMRQYVPCWSSPSEVANPAAYPSYILDGPDVSTIKAFAWLLVASVDILNTTVSIASAVDLGLLSMLLSDFATESDDSTSAEKSSSGHKQDYIRMIGLNGKEIASSFTETLISCLRSAPLTQPNLDDVRHQLGAASTTWMETRNSRELSHISRTNQDPSGRVEEDDRTGIEMVTGGLRYSRSLSPPWGNIDEAPQSSHETDNRKENFAAFVKWAQEQTSKPKYLRLVRRLNRLLQLDWAIGNQISVHIEEIRQLILQAKTSRHASQEQYRTSTVSFRLMIDVMSFLKYYHGKDTSKGIQSILVLVGSERNAQVVTCSQYMEQLWAFRGVTLLKVIDAAVAGEKIQYSCQVSKELDVTISVREDFVQVLATGNIPALQDIGSQLAWLCAALSFPKNNAETGPGDLFFAKASISAEDIKLHPLPGPGTTSPTGIRMDTKLKEAPRSKSSQRTGECWHKMFQGALILGGYPILRPPEPSYIGLEAPLDVMAELGNATFLTEFAGIPVLKGFSTFFVATRVSERAIQWHFVSGHQGDYLSYSETTRYGATKNKTRHWDHDQISFETVRNFIGWASSIRQFAGTEDFPYDNAGRSKAEKISAGKVLQSVALGGGKYLTGTATGALGTRNKELVAESSSDSYDASIKQLRNSVFVNFWDPDEHRGWLLDGATALLLLSRAQLTHQKSPRKLSCPKKLNFKHLSADWEPDGAQTALLNDHNKRIVLGYEPIEESVEVELKSDGSFKPRSDGSFEPKSDGSFEGKIKQTRKTIFFHHLVRANAEMLLKAKGYIEERKKEARGKYVDFDAKMRLDGWEYLDFLTQERSKKPVFRKLQPNTKGWVHLLRKVNAVTLFISGYGNFFEAAVGTNFCRHWSQVPIGQDYLAIPVSILKDIYDEHGRRYRKPLRLTKKTIWHQPGPLFEACQCDREVFAYRSAILPSRRTKIACHRAQELVETTLGLAWRARSPASDPFQEANMKGAVIFGPHFLGSVRGIAPGVNLMPGLPDPGPADRGTSTITSQSAGEIAHHGHDEPYRQSKRLEKVWTEISN